MLIPAEAVGESCGRHGGRRTNFAELRRRLASPSSLDQGQRQRLLELARSVARVQARGDEYGRVQVSEYVSVASDPYVTSV